MSLTVMWTVKCDQPRGALRMLAFSSPRAKGTVDPGPQHAPPHWCTGLRAHRSERMNGSAGPRVGSKKRGCSGAHAATEQGQGQPQESTGNGRGATQPPTQLGQPSGVSVLREVTVHVSLDTVPGDGSQQQEQPRETLIYNGIWVKHCLLQELSSQDIPKKPLERWGGKFLEVFG